MTDCRVCGHPNAVARQSRGTGMVLRYCKQHDPLEDDSVAEFFAGDGHV